MSKMKKPKISVIIPCYNVENYLAECLDSVLNQTFKDYEIICVEDCSSDKTTDILKKYAKKHKNLHVFYNETNQGMAISRNIGINKANGKYILFIDSDDSVSKNCIDVLYKKIIKDNCDIVMGAVKAYTEDKHDDFCITRTKYMNEWSAFKPFSKLQITENNADENYHNLYCCAWNKLYRKSFLTNNYIYFINKKCFHEDNGFWLKCLSCNPLISGISAKTYFYRIRKQSATNKMNDDNKMHSLHLRLSLKDALIFAKNRGNKRLSKFIYFEMYKLKQHKIIHFVWTKSEKRLKLLMIPVFWFYVDKNTNKHNFELFGIRIS
jgi:glycosyltransferase involved in cell wall biosynthesis